MAIGSITRLLDFVCDDGKIPIMLYMVIERFKEGAAPKVYRRFREKGRMMPEGLEYISNWIDLDFKMCWQIMETEDLAVFDQWIANWCDLADFEIVPVRTSTKAANLATQ